MCLAGSGRMFSRLGFYKMMESGFRSREDEIGAGGYRGSWRSKQLTRRKHSFTILSPFIGPTSEDASTLPANSNIYQISIQQLKHSRSPISKTKSARIALLYRSHARPAMAAKTESLHRSAHLSSRHHRDTTPNIIIKVA